MKKLISFVAIALLVMGFATIAFAVPPYASTDCFDTKYTITNNSAVKVTSVIPQDIIGNDGEYELLKVDVGQSITHTGTSAEAVVGIYDAATLLQTNNAFLECELESNDDDTASKTWIRPLKIYNGVIVVQGAYSVVTVEYQRAGR